MSDPADTACLEAFLHKAFEAQEADAHSFATEEEFWKIALRAGLSEENWSKLSAALDAHLSRGRNFLEFGNAQDAVRDQETLDLIQKMKGGSRLWLDTTDEEKEGEWKWIDGSAVECDAWAGNQPFNTMR